MEAANRIILDWPSIEAIEDFLCSSLAPLVRILKFTSVGEDEFPSTICT